MSLPVSTVATIPISALAPGTSVNDILVWNGATWVSSALSVVLPGPIRLSDGTLSAPTYSFVSETNTGMFRSGFGDIGFSVGGAAIMNVTSLGTVFTEPLIIKNHTTSIAPDDSSGRLYKKAGNSGLWWYTSSAGEVNVVNISTPDPIFLGNGTVGAPSYSFGAYTNCGVYIPAANTLGLAGNGVLGLSVSSTLVRTYLPVVYSNQAAASVPADATTGNLYKKTGSDSLWWNTTGAGEVDLTVAIHGPILLPAGSAAAPAYAFVADTGTGIYRAGASDLAIALGGVRMFDFLTSGILGPAGSLAGVAYGFSGDATTGMYQFGAAVIGLACAGVLILKVAAVAVTLGAVVRGVDGAVGAPAYSFTSETSTGFYWIGAADIGLALGGVLRFEFKSTGLDMKSLTVGNALAVGIGVALASVDANTLLDIAGTRAYGIYKHGTVTTDDAGGVGGGSVYGLYDATLYACAASVAYVIGVYARCAFNIATTKVATVCAGSACSPQFSALAGTITTCYGYCFDGGSLITGGGSIGTYYGGYFAVPVAAVTVAKIALGAANLSIGYGVTPPASGAIIAGNVSVGKSSNSYPLDVVGIIATSTYLYTSDGAVGTPSLTFTSDTSTGLYRIGAGSIGFACTGALSGYVSATLFGISKPLVLADTGTSAAAGATEGRLYKKVGSGHLFWNTTALGEYTLTDALKAVPDPLTLSVGSAAAPTYTFTGRTDTGMYSTAAGAIGLTAGGTLRATIAAAGITSTVPWLGPAGTVSLPGVSFSGTPDTGFYIVSATTVGFATAGAQRLYLDTLGLNFVTPAIIRDTGTSAAASGTEGRLYKKVGSGHLYWNTTTLGEYTLTDALKAVPDPLILSVGAVGAPTYTFTGRTTTGMYSSGAGLVSFAASGVLAMDIASSYIQPYFAIREVDGSLGSPAYAFASSGVDGLYHITNGVAFSCNSVLSFSTTSTLVNAYLPLSLRDQAGASAPGGATEGRLYKKTGSDGLYWNTFGSGEINIANPPLTGPLQLVSGSAAAPTYSFSADTSSGVYRVSASTVGVSCGGSLVFSVASSGIVSTAPYSVPAGLVSAPSVAFTGDLTTGMYQFAAGVIGFSTANFVALKLATSVISALTVVGLVNGTAGAPALMFTSDTTTGFYRIGASSIGLATGGTLRFSVDTSSVTSTLVYIAPAGAVGAPAYAFTGDTTTGLYRIGASDIGVALGGVLRFEFKSTGADVQNLALGNVSAVGIGVALASIDTNSLIDIAGTRAYGIYKHGSITTDSAAGAGGGFVYGFYENSTYATAASVAAVYGVYIKCSYNIATTKTATACAGSACSPQFGALAGTITTMYGYYFDGGSTITGGGSIGTFYGGYFAAPAAGTSSLKTSIALWAADLLIGATTHAADNGAIHYDSTSVKVEIGNNTSSTTSNTYAHLALTGTTTTTALYGKGLWMTNTFAPSGAASGGNVVAFDLSYTVTLPNATPYGSIYGCYVGPTLNGANQTVTNYWGFYANALALGGSAHITNCYGGYFPAQTVGSTVNIALWCADLTCNTVASIGATSSAGSIVVYKGDGVSSNKTTITTAASGARTITLPAAASTANYFLQATDTAGTLQWAAGGGAVAPLQLASGTAGTPTYSFSSDTACGLYRVGTLAVGMAINGYLGMIFDGNATPASSAQVNMTLFASAGSYGSGKGVLFVGNRDTAPSSNPTSGAIMYAESGDVRARTSYGVIGIIGGIIMYCKDYYTASQPNENNYLNVKWTNWTNFALGTSLCYTSNNTQCSASTDVGQYFKFPATGYYRVSVGVYWCGSYPSRWVIIRSSYVSNVSDPPNTTTNVVYSSRRFNNSNSCDSRGNDLTFILPPAVAIAGYYLEIQGTDASNSSTNQAYTVLGRKDISIERIG